MVSIRKSLKPSFLAVALSMATLAAARLEAEPLVKVTGGEYFSLSAVYNACTQDDHSVQVVHEIVFPLQKPASAPILEKAKVLYEKTAGEFMEVSSKRSFGRMIAADVEQGTEGKNAEVFSGWRGNHEWNKGWIISKITGSLRDSGVLSGQVQVFDSLDVWVGRQPSAACKPANRR